MNPDPLAQLRGYHLPDPVSWWPPAVGWWIVAVLLILLLVMISRWLLKRRRESAPRRAALNEFKALKAAHVERGDDLALVRNLSSLLRRYALATFPDQPIAGLTGESWLRFLDRAVGGDNFRRGAGRSLSDAPYRASADLSADALMEVTEHWIRKANREYRTDLPASHRKTSGARAPDSIAPPLAEQSKAAIGKNPATEPHT